MKNSQVTLITLPKISKKNLPYFNILNLHLFTCITHILNYIFDILQPKIFLFLGLEAIYNNKSNYIFCKYQICNLNMRNACKKRSFKMLNKSKFFLEIFGTVM